MSFISVVNNSLYITYRDENGKTPLDYNSIQNSPELVKILLEAGADVHPKGKAAVCHRSAYI